MVNTPLDEVIRGHREFLIPLLCCVVFIILLTGLVFGTPAASENVRVVEVDASYAMADSDTLASAEEQVLLRAKRKAVEQSGVYIETVFEDRETSRGETTSRLQSLASETLRLRSLKQTYWKSIAPSRRSAPCSM